MKRIGAAIVLLGVLIMPLAAQAGDILEHIHASGALRVGTTGDYKPFSFHNADGSYSGADIEMVQRLGKKLNVTIEFVRTAWSALSHDYEAKRFDLAVGGISRLPARAALGPFTHAVYTDGKRPIVRCADRDRYTSIATLNQPGVRIVVNPGASNEAFAHANLGAAQLTVHRDNVTVFDEIAAGRADAMVTDGAEVTHEALVHPGVLCAANVTAPFTHDEKAYWLQPDEDFLATVNTWLDGELTSGEWQRTFDRAIAQP
ncbi:MAG TPA: transporter substrate-binding domain-containing protein [Xanthobacteraceae bacterium]|jgi:cyclohexadienyl dehydratase|nr:transporter substrate-binding domain-containing protein [Xanthobacteraceae bacterium]